MAGNSIVFTDNLQEVLTALDGALETGLVKIGAAAQGMQRTTRLSELVHSVTALALKSRKTKKRRTSEQ